MNFKKILNKILRLMDKKLEIKNMEVLKSHLNENIDTVFDVGAHEGESIKLLNSNFKIKKIHAFEPNFKTSLFLKKNEYTNVILNSYAVSDTKGESILNIGNISSMSTLNSINEKAFYTFFKKLIIFFFYGKFSIYEEKIKINKIRLKDYIDENMITNIDILKIDTEGHDYNVLVGLDDKISKCRLILLEYHDDKSLIKSNTFEQLETFLKNKNFQRISKFKMIFRNSYELIYKNKNIN